MNRSIATGGQIYLCSNRYLMFKKIEWEFYATSLPTNMNGSPLIEW